MATVIFPSGFCQRIPTPTLGEMQKLVGGYIEIVYAPDGSAIVLNESGKLQGLEFNFRATQLWLGGQAIVAAAFQRRPLPDVIVGPVVVFDDQAEERLALDGPPEDDLDLDPGPDEEAHVVTEEELVRGSGCENDPNW